MLTNSARSQDSRWKLEFKIDPSIDLTLFRCFVSSSKRVIVKRVCIIAFFQYTFC